MPQQRVIVTGAAGQTGAAIVDVLVDRGAQVLAVDVDEAALRRFDGIEAVTPHVAGVAVEDDAEVARMVAVRSGPDSAYVSGTAHEVDGGLTTA